MTKEAQPGAGKRPKWRVSQESLFIITAGTLLLATFNYDKCSNQKTEQTRQEYINEKLSALERSVKDNDNKLYDLNSEVSAIEAKSHQHSNR